MTPPSYSRRDFLKLSAALPLAGLQWPRIPLGSLSAEVQTPNILFLVFDTVSAAHTSLMGYRRQTTPNMDRLAERSLVYHSCYSAGNFTSPGTASLLTGTYPWTHRALHMHGVPTDEFRTRNLFQVLSHRYTSLAYTHNLLVASLLHHFRSGLDHLKPTRDLCIVDDEYSDRLFDGDYNASFWAEWLALRGTGTPPSSLLLSLGHRLLRRVHKSQVQAGYGQQFPRGIPNLHSLFFVMEDAMDWMISEVPRLNQPFLAYVHLLPPHEPYSARRDFIDSHRDGWNPDPKPEGLFSQGVGPGELNYQRRLYDEYLSYADAELGRLLDGLERSGVWEDTMLVFTSDHGELFERGIRGHVTQALFDPVLHVPLMVSLPGQRARQDFHGPVSTIDILPTLLSFLGEPIPDWSEGEVLPGFAPGRNSRQGPVFAVEAKSNPKWGPLEKRSVTLIQDNFKLVDYRGYGSGTDRVELYDLGRDPEEMYDLSATHTGELHDLSNVLQAKLARVNAAPAG